MHAQLHQIVAYLISIGIPAQVGVASKLPVPSLLSTLHVMVSAPIMWNPSLHVAMHCPFQAVWSAAQLLSPPGIVGAAQVIADGRNYNLLTLIFMCFQRPPAPILIFYAMWPKYINKHQCRIFFEYFNYSTCKDVHTGCSNDPVTS